MLYDPKWETKVEPTGPVLDPFTKARWLEALRSGRYRKATGSFESGGAYCALGLLCTVIGEPTHDIEGSSNWLAIDPYISLENQVNVYKVSDGTGETFNAVADYIEANL